MQRLFIISYNLIEKQSKGFDVQFLRESLNAVNFDEVDSIVDILRKSDLPGGWTAHAHLLCPYISV